MSELDEIRAILRVTAEQQQQHAVEMVKLRQIVDSNAKAIEANSAAIAELRTAQRESIDDVVSMISTLAQTTDEYRRQAEADRAEIQRIWRYLQGQQRNGGSHSSEEG